VTTPIRNDTSPTINQDRGLKTRNPAGELRPGDPRSAPQAEAAKPPARSTEPDVARAAHLYNSETGARQIGEGAIAEPEDARSMVEELKEMIRANPDQALAAFGRGNPEQAAATLAQAPAV